MCSRYAFKSPAAEVALHFGVDTVPEIAPRYNIAPTQTILVIRQPWQQPDAKREAASIKWGLVPSWAKDASMAAKLGNARGETVAEKPAFRSAFRRMRCLIPADGFYEWESTPSGKPTLPSPARGRGLGRGENCPPRRWKPPPSSPPTPTPWCARCTTACR